MKKQTFLLALGCGALAVLIAANLYLHLGWGGNAVRLADESGDPAALEGFTLNGTLADSLYACDFTLEDGALTSTLSLQPPWNELAGTPAMLSAEAVVDPAALADLEAGCTLTEAVLKGAGGGRCLIYHGTTDRFVQQVTLQFPDGTAAVLNTRRITAETPVTVSAWRRENGSFTKGWSHLSYLPNGQAVQSFLDTSDAEQRALQALSGYSITEPLPNASLQLNGTWYILIGRSQDGVRSSDFGGMVAGVYRVQTVPQEEAGRQAATVLGQSLQDTGACGSADLIYTMPAGAVPVGLCSAGGSLCLYYVQDGLLWLALMDAGGNVTERTAFANSGSSYFTMPLQLDADQSCISYWSDTLARQVNTVVHVQNGKISASVTLPGANARSAAPALLLSRDDSRILVLSTHYLEGVRIDPDGSGEYLSLDRTLADGLTLEVYPRLGDASAEPLYSARLDAGQAQSWAGSALYGKLARTNLAYYHPDTFDSGRSLYLTGSGAAQIIR